MFQVGVQRYTGESTITIDIEVWMAMSAIRRTKEWVELELVALGERQHLQQVPGTRPH